MYAGWPRFIHGRARGKQVIREITFFFIIFPLVDLFRKKFEICHLALKIYADHLESKACFLSCPIKNAFVAFHFPEKGIIYIFLAKNWVLLSTGMAIFISSYLSRELCPVPHILLPKAEKTIYTLPYYLRRSRQIRERKVLFFLLLLLLLGDLGGLFSDLPCTTKMGASRENFS